MIGKKSVEVNFKKKLNKNHYKYADQLKRDEHKLNFCKANEIQLAEVYPKDEIQASLFTEQDIYL